MGLICSKTSRPITRVLEKTSSTPKVPQPQVQSKLDTNSTSLSAPTKKEPTSLSDQPRRGVVGDIAQNAAGVAIGTAVGRKISNMFDDKKDAETTGESSTETDNSKYNIDKYMKNEELTEDDSSEQGDEENDDDSD